MANKKLIVAKSYAAKRATKSSWIVSELFNRLYLGFALIVLLSTTIYWSLLGARLQLSNADQLVDPQLFKSLATFRGATFPGSHSLLIKWPIFWLINLFGSTNAAIEAFTVGLAVVTIAALVFIIYKIEHRQLILGTICLALASVLLLVPATPYAGALLPVNMAMLTTRNIEYILFIASVVLLVRSTKGRIWAFVASAVTLSLLAASDKLFLIITVVGALIALIIYAYGRAWPLVNLAVSVIGIGVLAAIGSYIILAAVSGSGLTHLTSAASASPYNLTSSPKNYALGITYGALGVLTNFGANPAFAATEVKNIPSQFLDHLASFAGPAYLINIVIMLLGLWAVYRVIFTSWKDSKSRKKNALDNPRLVSLVLIWSSIAAVISFVVTNHYYAVDARYLTVVLFAVAISFAAYSRRRKWSTEILLGTGAVIVVGIIFGLIGATKNYNADQSVLAPFNARNKTVSQILSEHHDRLLVGDYWRVLPIKQASANGLTVTPLASCLDPEAALDSSVWQPGLYQREFAYLLTLKGNLTNYPNCSISQILSAYGKPNSSELIAGSLTKPKELLLFYDRGIHMSAPTTSTTSTSSTVLPIPLSALPHTTCPVQTIMNIVAHEDDDLLFMSPNLINNINAGDCVRTVYVTAGNAGAGEYYWLGRQEGVEAAYSYMLHSKSIWIQRIVELTPSEFITVANPKGNAKISLIFMHLPDGNLKGQGFSSSDFESLAKLTAGSIKVINAVGNQSYYSSQQLIAALSTLMNTYNPAQIDTQSSFVGSRFPDHSDHLTVSWYVKQAYSQFEKQTYGNQVTIPIKFYEGYPGRQSPANVSGSVLKEKENAFLAYAKYDDGVCQTLQICLQTPSYNGYLARQYTNSY